MTRAPSSVVVFLRQNPNCPRQNSTTQTRKLTLGPKHVEFSTEGINQNQNHGQLQSINHYFTDVAGEVAKITKTNPKWEQTLLSQFPSLNFTNRLFFSELLKHQNDVFLSLKFFCWLRSQSNFVPDQVSCTLLFDSLLEAKACNAAKYFLEVSGFSPDQGSLERYVCCLIKVGMVQDAVDMFVKFKDAGVSPSIATWNFALSGCLNTGRTDLFWKLYQDLMESGVVTDIDVRTVEYLIRAFCIDGQVLKGYHLLRQVLENGLVPRNSAFNALISGFSKKRNYRRVSEILHTMIAKNCAPDIYTYQEVINGLCKNKMLAEALRVFNDLKDRGYAPDVVMYTTMIHGLCDFGLHIDAKKLWFEMINKGILPNEYTYNAMILGTWKSGDIEEALKLHYEMRDRGYGKNTISYNMMISNLFLHGMSNEALDLFEEMPRKGIVRDVVSYNAVIRGFCKDGRIVESKNLLNELLAQGLQPLDLSYIPLIEKLCELGDMKQAKRLWIDMHNRGLKPKARDYNNFITALCEQDCAVEGMKWLVFMLKKNIRPQKEMFEMVEHLSQCERDILLK